MKYLILIVCLIFFVTILGCSGNELPEVYKQETFNRDKWINQSFLSNEKPSPRQKMLNDLVKNILPGKSKKEIVELLGHPDVEGVKFIDYRIGSEISEYTISIDYEYFGIFFDDKDEFIKYSLTHS